MSTKLTCIMLIDDNEDDNLFHEIAIGKFDKNIKVIAKDMSSDALDYLYQHKNNLAELPDLILLDINLPMINGWEFLKKYTDLKAGFAKEIKLILLTTSDNPDDIEKSKVWNLVVDYYTKPLTLAKMTDIAYKYFS